MRATKRFAVEDRSRTWWNVIWTLAALVPALWMASAGGLHWGLRLLGSVLLTLVNVRCFVIYHDYLHGAILQNSRPAGLLFQIYGLLSLSPPSAWRHTHDDHHCNNSKLSGLETVGSYPTMTIDTYREAGWSARFFYALQRNPLIIIFAYLTVFFYSLCVVPLVKDPRHHKDCLAAILVHFGLLALLAIYSPGVMLFALVLPTFLGSAVGAYLFYAQHNYPDVKIRYGKDWDYSFAALSSSSYIRMSAVMAWFTGNIGYHHIHHLNSRIPFYRLPEAMAAMEELQTPSTTTLWPADIYRCLRLKLWDPEKDRLVSFAEYRETQDRSGLAA